MLAALFDFDGVIVDTEGQYTEFWGEMGRLFRPDVPDLAFRIKGQTLFQIYDGWFPDVRVRDEISQRLEAFEHTMRFPYIAGAKEYVAYLRQHNVKCAVVTSSHDLKMSFAHAAMPSLRTDVDAILTAESFTRSKPDPQCYLVAAERLGVAPKDCVVFEDSLNGIRSGKAAGMYTVGLATTNPKEVIAPLCDEVIADFRGYTKH